MKSCYLVGIDAGTTMMKSVVFDLEGNEIARAGYPAEIIHTNPGWAEEDMNAVWQAAARSCKEAIAKSGVKAQDIKAVSLSAQGGGTWLINHQGKPTRYAVTWLDGRSSDIIDAWKEAGIIDQLVETCGLVYYSGSGPGVIFRWFIENDRGALEDSKAQLWPKDWVRYCLTGEIMTDPTDASMGMIDPQTRQYSRQVLELTKTAEFGHLLPPIRASHELGGTVTRAAAEATGLAEGTPVAVGAWDCSSTALGQGCVNAGDAFSIIGTAGIHMLINDRPDINRAFSLSCHTVPAQYMVHSMAMTAANNLDWFEREFGLAERLEAEKNGVSKYDVINAQVASVPVGANGVYFLPYLQGERAPFVETRARGEFLGLGDGSTRQDMYRAVYEGVALATLHNYRAMELSRSFERVRLGGGGAQSEVWAQMLADCTGRVMEVTSGSEYGARGAAINAGIAVGLFTDHAEAVGQMVKVKRVHEPNPALTRTYADIFEIYARLAESHMKLWVDMYRLVEARVAGKAPAVEAR